MMVWLTDWQVAEERLLVEVGDVVAWTLHASDVDWVARLLGDRLDVAWQRDTYFDAVVQPSREVRGRVTGIRGVRCRQLRTDEGIVPEPGAATLHPVRETSGSWSRSRASADDDGALYGYVVALEGVADDAAAGAGRPPSA